MRLQQILFICSFALFSLTAFSAAEPGGAEASVAGLEGPARLEAGAELESGGKWQSTVLGGMSHSLILGLGWNDAAGLRNWRLGLDSEAVLTSSSGDPGGFLDTELTIARTGLPLGAYGELSAGSLTILPTARAERDGGMSVAQGAILAWGMEPASGLGLELEVKGARFFRSEERAAGVATEAVPATEEAAAVPAVLHADALDRWRLEEKLTVTYSPLARLGVEASVKHGSGWKWFAGREDLLTLEQVVRWELEGGWSLGLGHRNETKLTAQDGTRRRIALFRPDESRLFGSLAWEL